MELYSIDAGSFKLDGGAMFGVVPKVLWQKKYPADEKNLCTWAMRCLLAVEGNRCILIDNGIGDKQDEKFFSYYQPSDRNMLYKSLARHGFSADDVTDVVISHLHFDHCGGSIKYNDRRTALVPAFKKANFWVSRLQWDWAKNPNRRERASFLKENILPIEESGNLKFIEEDTELFPGFFVRLYYGHTEGQIIPFIKYKGTTVVFMADLLPSTAHLPVPYIMSYDIRPLISLEEKEKFLQEALQKDYILFFEHDLYNECCNLQETSRGIKEKECFKLENI